MTSIFHDTAFIHLGWNDEAGYFLEIKYGPDSRADVIVPCGTAETAAGLMKANSVQHFDYLDSVANTDALDDWLTACEWVRYAV